MSSASLSVDGKEAWRSLRKELQFIGITPDIFTQYRQFILSTLQNSLTQGEIEDCALPFETGREATCTSATRIEEIDQFAEPEDERHSEMTMQYAPRQISGYGYIQNTYSQVDIPAQESSSKASIWPSGLPGRTLGTGSGATFIMDMGGEEIDQSPERKDKWNSVTQVLDTPRQCHSGDPAH